MYTGIRIAMVGRPFDPSESTKINLRVFLPTKAGISSREHADVKRQISSVLKTVLKRLYAAEKNNAFAKKTSRRHLTVKLRKCRCQGDERRGNGHQGDDCVSERQPRSRHLEPRFRTAARLRTDQSNRQ